MGALNQKMKVQYRARPSRPAPVLWDFIVSNAFLHMIDILLLALLLGVFLNKACF